MVELCGTLDVKAKSKCVQKAQLMIEEKKQNNFILNFKEYLLGDHMADIYSGYRNPSLEKFTEMVVFFSEKTEPFKTKMNKLLFYADFLMFKQSCFSISGMRYKAIDMGPVPNNFQSIFEYIANNDDIDIHTVDFQNSYIGEQFKARKDRPFKADLFLENELLVLEKVAASFKSISTNDIIKLSHLEEAWKQNKNKKNVISYEHAFELSQIDFASNG
jgi:hypothetical protein